MKLLFRQNDALCNLGRSPCGERGLKFGLIPKEEWLDVSLPVRGAWIEIIYRERNADCCIPSLPVRGAWIEIGRLPADACRALVAPRAGSVD